MPTTKAFRSILQSCSALVSVVASSRLCHPWQKSKRKSAAGDNNAKVAAASSERSGEPSTIASERSVSSVKLADEALLQIADNINEAMWILNMVGPKGPWFSYASKANETQLGLSPEKIVGMTIAHFVATYVHEDDAHIYQRREQARGDGKPAEFVTRIRKEGTREIRWMRVRTFPVISSAGLPRSVGLVEDITDKRSMESELATQRLQALEAAKMASLGTLAAGIAHEINNPLFQIRGVLHTLKSRQSSGKLTAEASLRLLESADAMAEKIFIIVRGLRTFARSNETSQLSDDKIVNLIEDALAVCQPSIELAGIKVTTSFGVPTGSLLRCHPNQIVQVFIILLQNAFDAAMSSRTGEGRWVRLEAKILEGGILEIACLDSGPGVPDEIASRIMEPFFTTKPVDKGMGLGLSIALGIVNEHGGSLELDRRSPATRFVLRLPGALPPAAG